jgi:hypothetical protein
MFGIRCLHEGTEIRLLLPCYSSVFRESDGSARGVEAHVRILDWMKRVWYLCGNCPSSFTLIPCRSRDPIGCAVYKVVTGFPR